MLTTDYMVAIEQDNTTFLSEKLLWEVESRLDSILYLAKERSATNILGFLIERFHVNLDSIFFNDNVDFLKQYKDSIEMEVSNHDGALKEALLRNSPNIAEELLKIGHFDVNEVIGVSEEDYFNVRITTNATLIMRCGYYHIAEAFKLELLNRLAVEQKWLDEAKSADHGNIFFCKAEFETRVKAIKLIKRSLKQLSTVKVIEA